jgi:hypothetical protein
MRTTERWLDIPGYVDCYQFSTLGRVRSLPRIGPGPSADCLGSIKLLGRRFSLNLIVRKVFGSRAEHKARQKVRR